MRRALFLAFGVTLVAAVAGTAQAKPPADIRSRPFAFTARSLPDSNFSEPSVALTRKDAVLFCGPHRPTNAYIRSANWSTFTRSDVGLAGGSDCDVKVGKDNAVYLADLQIFGTEVLKSTDDGTTFAAASRSEDPVEQDRQWLATDPTDPNILYLAFHDLALESEVVAKSTDGGRTFVNHAIASNDPALASDTFPNTFSGPVRVDPTNHDRVYLVYGTSTLGDNAAMCANNPTNCPFGEPRKVLVARSDDGGQTWKDAVAIDSPAGSVLGNLFPWMTIDAAGNVYVAAAGKMKNADGSFTNGIFVSVSKDHGATWSPKTKVNTAPGAIVFPTIVAGASGMLDVAWIQADVFDQTKPGKWALHFAQSRDATAARPHFTEVLGPIIRNGVVRTFGINCNGNRELGDFFEIALDSFGYAHIAVTSTIKSPDGSSSTNRETVWWRQDAGPSATSEPCAKGTPCVTARPIPK